MQSLIKTLRIQTGVVRRLRGDYESYIEEISSDNARVAELSSQLSPDEAPDSELSYRLRQARAVVAESKEALADTGLHLDRAVKGLEEVVEKVKAAGEEAESDEVKELLGKAEEVLKKAKETLAKELKF